MRLSHRDFDIFTRSVLELHSHRSEHDLRQAVHAILLGAIPGDYSQVVETQVDFAGGQAQFLGCWESYDLTTPDIVERFQRVLLDHPFTKAGVLSGRPDLVGKLSDYFSRRQYRSTRLYGELYRHVDVGDLLGTAILSGNRHLAVSLSRHASGRDFSERDRFMLSLLRPHFERARLNTLEAANAAGGARPVASYGLTPRESQVAEWLAAGKTNPEIAVILDMRTRTVEKHAEHVLAKLGVENRTAAALVLTRSPKT
jgi:DNA-binding CsgD family transcriptional regulator